jgi:4-aminobutyrate aminotransferase-like enzyme/Ser/Thr protein kinase RdoA (MazF antagonist)
LNAQRDVLLGEPPTFTAEAASELAARWFGLIGAATPLGSERDQGFLIVGGDGPVGVLKISNTNEDAAILDMETRAALHVRAVDPSIPVAPPLPLLASHPVAYTTQVAGPTGSSHFIRANGFVPGRSSVDANELDGDAVFEHGVTIARLGRALRSFFHPAAARVLLWDVQHALALRPMTGAIDPAHRSLVVAVLDRFETFVVPQWPQLRSQVIHGDVTLDNALVDERGRISGIVDWGDMSFSALVCDLTSALESLLAGRDQDQVVSLAMRFIDGYRSITSLEPNELVVLPDLLCARLVTVAVLFSWQSERHPANEYLRGWETTLWPLLEYLRDEGCARLRGRLRVTDEAPDPGLAVRRARAFGPALAPLTYDRPLHLVRGDGVWLYDADGAQYLDCYNNVPVVGHGHPRVTDAIARQSRLLNTNMRYLSGPAIELAERLVTSMPAGSGLDTVLLMNSGSEANDTAWRLATVWAEAEGGLATRHAYHGMTKAITDLSPEEWRGESRPAHVELFDPPPTGLPETDAVAAANELIRASDRLQERGLSPAVTFVDGGFTSDGILDPPAAYVQALADRSHDVGAVYVADEVQMGHGRGGQHLWSFAAMKIDADIVTMGKPMGNGHPVAAVVTRREITERLGEATEWFSTFGGNPVACAAALAVLDVIEDEDLIARASWVGTRLRKEIAAIGSSAIADVRGPGLLTGVEIVADTSRGPDPARARAMKNMMRERGVLIGSTGPVDHVLKIRPPLTFGDQHIDLVVTALADCLAATAP